PIYMTQKLILFDTEYTAWEGSQQRRWSEAWEHREIIQIAAVRVALSGGMVEEASFNRLVRPQKNPILSEYIRGLTGISQAAVDSEGVPFAEAFADFTRFIGEGAYPLFSWGDDPGVLRENCELGGLPFPVFEGGFHDIRDVLENSGIQTAQYSSGTVWQALELGMDLAAHDALNDVHSLLATLHALEKQGRVDPARLLLPPNGKSM
ncbi:MAG: exonuclease domain-containing protein, partial [Anaerolineaceae bacterium]|nr:exonuclease domain-containing protein [Anaerolineaceae bacterium]